MSNCYVDELQKKREEKKEAERKLIENVKISAEIFNCENGKFFLKFLMNTCLWNSQDNEITPNKVVYDKGRRDIWAIIRNVIPKDVLADIEIYG